MVGQVAFSGAGGNDIGQQRPCMLGNREEIKWRQACNSLWRKTEKEGAGRNGRESLNQSSKVLEWLRGIAE